jgi:hypothetical protein
MGGDHEVKVKGQGMHAFKLQGTQEELRVHRDPKTNQVHVHRDADKVKFAWPAKTFSKDYFDLKSKIIDDGEKQAHLMDSKGIKLVATEDGSGIVWSLDDSGAKVIPDGFEEMDDFVSKLDD